MKTILCYGDSNTWGFMPGGAGRYAHDVRWTGLLQAQLGHGYHVVEDGINGRTSVFDDPLVACRNGREGLGYALCANKPLDLVILMLGTNDLKYVRAEEAAAGARTLIELMQHAGELFPGATPVFTGNRAKVLLIAPIHIRENALPEGEHFLQGESLRFAPLYEAVARETGVAFLDAARYAEPSPTDGTHMEPAGHKSLAAAIAEAVREII